MKEGREWEVLTVRSSGTRALHVMGVNHLASGARFSWTIDPYYSKGLAYRYDFTGAEWLDVSPEARAWARKHIGESAGV